MFKIIFSLVIFVTLAFILFQFPEVSPVFFPLSSAFALGVFVFINAETAVLYVILLFFISFGVLRNLSFADCVLIAGNIASLICVVVAAYRFESRKKIVSRRYISDINHLEHSLHTQEQERSRLETELQALNVRGFLQERMGSVIRDLAGTLDPVIIRKHMFDLLKEMIPESNIFLVSSSKDRDPADEWVVRQRVPILSRDVPMDGRFIAKNLPKQVQSLIVAPIVIQGKVEDIIRIESEQKNTFDLANLRMVELITLMAAVSLGNARLYTLAESRAMTDGLTGLFTQNYFIEKLHQELLFARRYKMPVTIMMIDVDYFKNINDTYGHQVGDAVLKAIGKILHTATQPLGSAARYGGEEFALLFPKTGRSTAKETGLKILQTVQNASFNYAEFKGIRSTISIGISIFPEDGEQEHQLLGVADSNLYRAKASGRNRLIG